jgi:micrococcal nuclease
VRRRWALAAFVGVSALLFACGPPTGETRRVAPDGDRRTHLVEVVDGDTLRVRLPGGEVEAVRLIGVNAPERGECLSQDAAAALRDLVGGGELVLEADTSDRDRYGRLLRYVYAGEVLVNEALVESGLALARRYEPDTAFAERLEAAQGRAVAADAGLWTRDACGAAVDAEVEIVEVEPGIGAARLNDEWVAVANRGRERVALTGWVVKDTSASHRFTFPDGYALDGGRAVRVYSGCGQASATALYWCNQGSAIWNNDGDTAFLLDPSGNVVDTRTYPD